MGVMTSRLRNVTAGSVLSPSIVNGLNAQVRRCVPIAGKGIRVEHTVGGSIISVNGDVGRGGRGGGGGEEDTFLCEITGGTATGGYTCKVMNEKGEFVTDDKRRIFFTEIAVGYDLKAGTRVIAHAVKMAVNGGSDT